MSYGNMMTEFVLERPGTTLIVGENLDDTTNGRSSNGVGKTTIVNAISFCLYDQPLSDDMTKDELVNDINQKNMEVAVDFSVEDKQYFVHRTRKMKAGAAGNNVYFYEIIDEENRVDLTLDSMDATNKRIVEVLGIPFAVFKVIVAFAASEKSFLNLKTKDQVEFIEHLFELLMLSEKARVLKDVDMREVEQKINLHKQKIDQQQKEQERYKTQLETAKKRAVDWETKNNQTMSELETKLAKIDNIDFDKEKRIHDGIKTIEKHIVEPRNERSLIQKEIKTLLEKIKKNEGDLKHLRDAKCPFCLQKYEDAQSKITECEDLSLELATTLDLAQLRYNSLNTAILSFEEDYQTLKSTITVSNLEELLTIKNQSEGYKQKLKELEEAENPHMDALEELARTKIEEPNYEEINSLTKIIDHQKFLHKLLTKKDSFIRKALLNKNLPYLNLRVAKYLTDLGLPLKVEFSHELVPVITHFGRGRGFGNLSNGQKARVNLALSLAFRDVLQNLHNKINICLLDEVLDVGLDEPGVESAARLLKQKARDENLSLYIISHRNEIDRAFDRTVTVRYQNSFSTIMES